MKEDEIINLIQFSPNNLREFFDKSLIEVSKGVPGYGVLLKEPITFYLAQSPTVNQNNIGNLIIQKKKSDDKSESHEEDENALPVVFKSIRFSYNYEPGSQSSINLLDSLAGLENIQVFRSPAI